MNSRFKKFLSLLMAFALILQYSVSLTVFAEDTNDDTAVVSAAEEAPKAEKEEKAEQSKATEDKQDTASETAPAEKAESESSSKSEEPSAPAEPEQQGDAVQNDDSGEAASPDDTSAIESVSDNELADADDAEEDAELDYPAVMLTGAAGGVSVTVNAPEGALPEGVKMVVTAVAAGQVESAVENAIGGEAGAIKAVDISFRHDGKEIEPKKAVSVKLNAAGMDAEADKHVVHIDDSGNASVVSGASVSDSGVATFKASDFSIYIVVDEDRDDKEHDAVATYEFYVEDELKQTQYVKTGDKLVDPGDLAGDGANVVFKGWYVGDAKLDFSNALTVSETETITVKAKVEKTYYVTFLGEKLNGERAIVGVKSVVVEGDKTGSLSADDLASIEVIPKKDTSVFLGWATADDSTDTVSEVTGINKHMTLYAVVVNANWIRFDENDGGAGGGASYTGPVAVRDGQKASAVKPADPTRTGYTFGGWYKDADCTEAFNWDSTISEDVTLYAKWNENTNTKYTIIVWKQKVTDDKGAADADKTYDYEESHVVNGTTNSAITASMYNQYTRYSYTGFSYSRVDSNYDYIRGKGDTVINVYYDRNLNTINFRTYQRSGFSGSWQIYQTMTGLYGQTLAQNGYTWPTDYDWYTSYSGSYTSGTHVTFLDSFTDGDKTVNLYGESASQGTYYIRHYKQNTDGSYPSTPTNYTRSNGGTWTFTEKYDGFTVSQYSTNNSSWTNTSADKTYRYSSNLYIRYTRNTYTLSFQDGDSIVDSLTVKNIPYEKALSSYKPTTSPYVKGEVKDHMVFEGWFEDASGTTEFDWSSKMPAANKVVYAKWTPERYKVTLDFNGGTVPAGQATEFTVDYLDTISQSSLEQTTREGYELVGWFDKDTNTVYGFPKVEKNTNLVAKWRYPGQVQIVYDAGDHGLGEPTDSYKYATDSSVVLGAPPTTIDSGYTFVGWSVGGTTYYTNNTFDITDTLIEDYDPETKTGTVTITAIYAGKDEGSLATTSITYKANGGTGDDVVVSKNSDGEDLNVNESVTALTVDEAKFSRKGYEFTGWNTSADGSGLDVAAGDKIAADKLKIDDGNTTANTLYAQWEQIKYKVVYTDGVDDEVVFEDETHESLTLDDDTPAFNKGTDPTRDGYTFDGWNPEVTDKVDIESADENNVITYTAKWKEKEVEIKYEATTGGSVDPASETVKVVSGTIAGSTATADDGYEFVNWTDADGNEVSTDETFVPTEKVAATYTANFEEKEVEVKYEATTGGSVDPASETVKVVSGTIAGSTATAEEGYEFVNWTDADGNEVSTDETFVPTDKVAATYTANFKAKEYTVTYTDGVDGAAFENQSTTATYGSATPEFSGTPSRDGYTFEGWSPEVAKTVTENATYTAQWKAVDPDPEPTPDPDPEPEPTPTPDTTPTPTPTPADDDDDDGGNNGGGNKTTPAAAAVTPAPVAPAVIDDEPTPQAEPETIIDDPTPQAEPEGTWALINLLCAGLATVGAVLAAFRKKDEDDDEEDPEPDDDDDETAADKRKARIAKGVGIAAAVASIVAFILTEDLSNPMALTDQWTLLMAVLFGGQAVAAGFTKKYTSDDEEEEDAE